MNDTVAPPARVIRPLRPARMVILSRNKSLYSTRRLVEAARARGHVMTVVDPLRCYMHIAKDDPQIHFRGKRLTGVDVVLPRVGSSVTFYGTAVLRQFEMMGAYTPNPSDGILRSRDKLRAAQIMAQAGINMPLTVFGSSPDDTDDLLAMLGTPPHVIKLVEGTQGQGVVLAETANASQSLIEAFRGLKAHFLIQEFISEAKGADIRAFVVGGKVVAAMERRARAGEFRANLHRGGTADGAKLTRLERETALAAASCLGLNVAGVDLLRSDRGPLVLEVNSSPGLEGIERATGLDIAGMIIDYAARRSMRRRQVDLEEIKR